MNEEERLRILAREFANEMKQKNSNEVIFDWVKKIFSVIFSVFLIFFIAKLFFLISKNEQKNFLKGIDVKKYEKLKFYLYKEKMNEILQYILNFNSDNATKRNILFFGEPGTGKTFFIKKMAYFLFEKLQFDFKKSQDLVYFQIFTPSTILSKFYGESSKNFRKIFSDLIKIKSKIKILFFDEIDFFMEFDGEKNYIYENRNLTSEILNILDGADEFEYENYFFIGTTNKDIKKMSSRFSRRFHKKIEFCNLCDDEIKNLIFEFFTENENRIKNNEKINLKDLSGKSLDFIIKYLEDVFLIKDSLI